MISPRAISDGSRCAAHFVSFYIRTNISTPKCTAVTQRLC